MKFDCVYRDAFHVGRTSYSWRIFPSSIFFFFALKQNRELQIMRRLDHSNIVQLKYFFYSSGDKVRYSTFWLDHLLLLLYSVPPTPLRISTSSAGKSLDRVSILTALSVQCFTLCCITLLLKLHTHHYMIIQYGWVCCAMHISICIDIFTQAVQYVVQRLNALFHR